MGLDCLPLMQMGLARDGHSCDQIGRTTVSKKLLFLRALLPLCAGVAARTFQVVLEHRAHALS